jgi:hypothetical protein
MTAVNFASARRRGLLFDRTHHRQWAARPDASPSSRASYSIKTACATTYRIIPARDRPRIWTDILWIKQPRSLWRLLDTERQKPHIHAVITQRKSTSFIGSRYHIPIVIAKFRRVWRVEVISIWMTYTRVHSMTWKRDLTMKLKEFCYTQKLNPRGLSAAAASPMTHVAECTTDGVHAVTWRSLSWRTRHQLVKE